MNSDQITDILSKDKYAKRIFKGCYPKDDTALGRVRARRPYILNTDTRYGEGIHWIGLYTNATHCYIFDSYAYNAMHDNHMRRTIFLLKGNKKLVQNKSRVQPLTSSTCGLYAILFVLWMSRNYSYTSFLKFFACYSFQENDEFICTLMKEMYPVIEGLNLL